VEGVQRRDGAHTPLTRARSSSLLLSPSPQDLAKTNLAFVSVDDPAVGHAFLEVNGWCVGARKKGRGARSEGRHRAHTLTTTLPRFSPSIFATQAAAGLTPGTLALNAVQRRAARVSSGDGVDARPFPVVVPGGGPLACVLAQVEVDHVSRRPPPAKGTPPDDLPAGELAAHLLARFGGQVFAVNQAAAFEFQGVNYTAKILAVATAGGGGGGGPDGHHQAPPGKAAHDAAAGLLNPDTALVFAAAPGAHLAFPGQARGGVPPSLFKGSEVSFAKLGIGGLDAQFEQIFRRAFASRVFPPAVIERLGIHHVRGVLLYGPPGTGKTLIARQIGKMLNGRDPKIVNGPEILNKYVGASEENVRALFKDAEEEQAARGAESELHVIIFDEIDAICKQRGSGGAGAGAGVHDTVVNQLLTKIDGVDALDNILLIGMTNRRDMLDDALLRPGRLEVQVEVGLPDEAGRRQIFAIHTARMSEHAFLGADVDLGGLAARTKNFSGAEIEGLVKSAASFALNRQVRKKKWGVGGGARGLKRGTDPSPLARVVFLSRPPLCLSLSLLPPLSFRSTFPTWASPSTRAPSR